MVEHRAARILAAFVALLAPTACSALVSTSGLSGGASAPDAASGSDATTSTESGADVTAEASVDAAGPFCKGRVAAFCADFDGDDLLAGWTGQVARGGTIARGTDAVSAPFAMVATVGAAPGTSDGAARLFWTAPAIPSAVHLELDVRFDGQTSGLYEPVKIELPTTFEGDTPGQLSAAMELSVNKGGTLELTVEGWDEAGTKYRTPYPGSVVPMAGTWSHLVVDAALAANNGSVRVTVNGVPTVDLKGIRTLSANSQSTRIVVGQYVYGTSSATVMAYDNVLVTVTP